jgi:uncharacterized protein (DUF433 family)
MDAWCKLLPQERNMDTSLVRRDSEVMSGALCFSGTRVPVKNLFDYLEGSSTLEDFLADFPSISRTTAVSVLEAARERLAFDATAA